MGCSDGMQPSDERGGGVGRLSKKGHVAVIAYEEWAKVHDFYPCPKCGWRNPEDGETARWATSAESFEQMGAEGYVLEDSFWRRPTWEIWKTFGPSIVSPAGFIGLRCKKCDHEWVALCNVGPPL
jgi:hypothetical protein